MTGSDVLKAGVVALRETASLLATLGSRLSAEETDHSTARLQGIDKRMQALAKRVTLRAKGSDDLVCPLSEAVDLVQESCKALAESGLGSHQGAVLDFLDDLESLEREVGVLEETVRSRTLVLT